MLNKFEAIIYKLSAKQKNIFLIDGLGALLTAFLLVVILARFEPDFGMQQNILYLLASIASLYMLYSFICYFFLKKKFQTYLMYIIIANLLYACLTLSLVLYFYKRLTALGITYFLLEIGVIAGLSFIEKRVYNLIKH